MKKTSHNRPSRGEASSDFYRLHIHESRPAKKGPTQEHLKKTSLLVASDIPKKNHENIARSSPDVTSGRFGGGIAAWLWDKVQFLLVSAFVFAVIYVVMNWQALSLNAAHFWNVWRGVESPLQALVQDAAPPEEKIVTKTSPITRAVAPVPPLDMEVYPPDMRLVIPRINQNVPVVGVKNENLVARQWDSLEADIQNALRNGVIHYPGTALPGDNGNVVLTGHSSYYAWDPGRFKDVFALLHDVKIGDKIVVYFNQKKFVYEVEKIKVILPKDVDVLGAVDHEQLTLITCTPIGTNLKRLVLTAKLIQKL